MGMPGGFPGFRLKLLLTICKGVAGRVIGKEHQILCKAYLIATELFLLTSIEFG